MKLFGIISFILCLIVFILTILIVGAEILIRDSLHPAPRETYELLRNFKQFCEFWLYLLSLMSIGFGIAGITQKSKKTLAIIAIIISGAILMIMLFEIGYFGSSPSFRRTIYF